MKGGNELLRLRERVRAFQAQGMAAKSMVSSRDREKTSMARRREKVRDGQAVRDEAGDIRSQRMQVILRIWNLIFIVMRRHQR